MKMYEKLMKRFWRDFEREEETTCEDYRRILEQGICMIYGEANMAYLCGRLTGEQWETFEELIVRRYLDGGEDRYKLVREYMESIRSKDESADANGKDAI